MNLTNNLTVVYTINDRAAFEEEAQRVHASFKSSKGEPWAITAMSLSHELHRLHLIEEAHEQDRHDLLDDIFGMIDPMDAASIKELAAY